MDCFFNHLSMQHIDDIRNESGEDWNSDTTPPFPGLYRTRHRIIAVVVHEHAEWDGQKWLYPGTELECYFQVRDWQGIPVLGAL
jgi:hypothetical protein